MSVELMLIVVLVLSHFNVVKCYFFNFAAAITSYRPLKWIRTDSIDAWITNGCELYTPKEHRYWDEPMF